MEKTYSVVINNDTVITGDSLATALINAESALLKLDEDNVEIYNGNDCILSLTRAECENYSNSYYYVKFVFDHTPFDSPIELDDITISFSTQYYFDIVYHLKALAMMYGNAYGVEIKCIDTENDKVIQEWKYIG